MITRAMGDSIAFCPPLISTKEEIQLVVDIFSRALDDTDRWFGLGVNQSMWHQWEGYTHNS
jgi:4-aminobutyrate--pyruvate transaminase